MRIPFHRGTPQMDEKKPGEALMEKRISSRVARPTCNRDMPKEFWEAIVEREDIHGHSIRFGASSPKFSLRSMRFLRALIRPKRKHGQQQLKPSVKSPNVSVCPGDLEKPYTNQAR